MKDAISHFSHIVDEIAVFGTKHQMNYHRISHKVKFAFVNDLTGWTKNVFINWIIHFVLTFFQFRVKLCTIGRYLLFLMQYVITQTFTSRINQNDQTKPILIIFTRFGCFDNI